MSSHFRLGGSVYPPLSRPSRVPARHPPAARLPLDGREPRASIDVGRPNPVRIETSVYNKKLGIFLNVPAPGDLHTRLVPPLALSAARDLQIAFFADLLSRIAKLKKMPTTVFHGGDVPSVVQDLVPPRCSLVPQEGSSDGERLDHAFGILLEHEGSIACVIGARSPDVPLVYLKRAYAKLKHRDVVLGPTFEGGLYLIALKRFVSGLLPGAAWNDRTALRNALGKVRSEGLSCTVLPPWYEVSTMETLSLLETMLLARRIEGRDRLRHVEKVLGTIRGTE